MSTTPSKEQKKLQKNYDNIPKSETFALLRILGYVLLSILIGYLLSLLT